MHLSWSPAFFQITIVLLPAPSPKVDLLSFSFHVPNVGLSAKHIVAAPTESRTPKLIFFVLINFSFLIPGNTRVWEQTTLNVLRPRRTTVDAIAAEPTEKPDAR